MTHDLRITLTAEEVQKAIIAYATKNLDFGAGVQFSRENISIDYLSSTMGGELRITVGELAPVPAALVPFPPEPEPIPSFGGLHSASTGERVPDEDDILF